MGTGGFQQRNVRFGQRIPAMRRAVAAVLQREGAGLSVLEVQSCRDGALAQQAAVAVNATKRDMQALGDVLALLDYLEAGGS